MGYFIVSVFIIGSLVQGSYNIYKLYSYRKSVKRGDELPQLKSSIVDLAQFSLCMLLMLSSFKEQSYESIGMSYWLFFGLIKGSCVFVFITAGPLVFDYLEKKLFY